MSEPMRPMPNPEPLPNGDWLLKSTLTPEGMNTRAMFTVPTRSVVPVIVVPGIMGTNLRAKTNPRTVAERNRGLNPGQEAWRPPNSIPAGISAGRTWKQRAPDVRQRILDGGTLEVDNTGDVDLPLLARNCGINKDEARARWWGEVHADSYGALLYALEFGLNHTFDINALNDERVIRQHWKDVMKCEPQKWGVRSIEQLTETELENLARHYYPVYACGYNWLECCDKSADRLEKRILEVIKFWTDHKRKCTQVILVTHSMGGLVGRACAKRIPDKIAGVIHGVMPALGAPACYRRIACGTETKSPSNGPLQNAAASTFADIAGTTTEATTAVMATAPGPLELLPNHLYPSPWLHVGAVSTVNNKDTYRGLLHLPAANTSPYSLYKDFDAWYRLIDPAVGDPAGKYDRTKGGVERAIIKAIEDAEWFHTTSLDDYYHPHTYAFYGADPAYRSFGQVHWVARQTSSTGAVLTPSNVEKAQVVSHTNGGGRIVIVEGKTELRFEPEEQDTQGDGTVPRQSGAGPAGKIKQLFETRGYSHQESFKGEDMLMLTQYLIVKIVQRMP